MTRRGTAGRAIGAAALAAAAIGALAMRGHGPSGARMPQAGVSAAEATQLGRAGERRKPELARFAADSPGKPRPPIELDYALLGVPVPGQSLQIRLNARTRDAAGAVEMAVTGSGALWIAPGAAGVAVERARGVTGSAKTIEVVPLESGAHHLDVLLAAVIAGRVQSRSVAIPIQAGPGGPPAAERAVVSTDASGQQIFSLPATSVGSLAGQAR